MGQRKVISAWTLAGILLSVGCSIDAKLSKSIGFGLYLGEICGCIDGVDDVAILKLKLQYNNTVE